MPSKKSKKSGGNKSKKDNKKEIVKLSELDKEVYLIQIKDLEDKLQRYMNMCVELETKCSSYEVETEQMATDKYDTVEYLKRELELRNNEIQALNEHLKSLQIAQDVDQMAHEKLVAELKVQHQETKDQLTSENIVLGGKLASLEEFKILKEKTFAKIEQLEERLKTQEIEHRESMRLTEKTFILDKDQLKREMMFRLEEIGTKFRQVSNLQMAETTRRVIEENASLGSHIDRLDMKVVTVMADNQRLLELKGKHILKIKELESIESDLIKRNVTLIKLVVDHRSKINENNEKLKQIEPLMAKNGQLEENLERLKAELETFREEATLRRQSNDKLMDTLRDSANKLKSMQINRESTEAVLYNAAIAIRDSLKYPIDDESNDSRDEALGGLLAILNAASETKQLPAPFFNTTNSIAIRRPSDGEEYLLGDIGIVPPESSVSSITGARISHGVRSRTTATQTEQDKNPISGGLFPRIFPSNQFTQRQQPNDRSAAYRILQDVGFSSTDFYNPDNVTIPKSRALTARIRRR